MFPLHHCLSLCACTHMRTCVCTGGCILSVAVVKNSSLDISTLRGLRSCHSGIRWTAGWSLPLGFLLSRNYLSWSKEHPLSHGGDIIIHCTVWNHHFSFTILGSVSFQAHSNFILPGRCQQVFQSQLHSWCHCSGTIPLHSVPRRKVLQFPEELPLRDISQRALLQQPRGPQVRSH